MKIAIIGAADSVKKIYKILVQEEEGIEFIKYEEDKIKRLINIAKNIENDVNGIFFTGIGVYSELSSEIEFKQPIVYAERDILGLVKALYEFHMEWGNTADIRIALDLVEERDLIDVLDEFNIKVKDYDIQKYLPSKRESEYLNYYLEEYNNGKIDCVFTSFGYIYQYLKEYNIPVYRVQATNIGIRNQFLKLKNKIKLENIQDKVTQVQIVQVVESDIEKCNDKEVYLSLKEELLKYSNEIQGIMQTISSREYRIISNKGALLSEENIKHLSSIINYYKSNNIILAVGIGEGVTIYQTEINARNALRKSSSEKFGNIYFYDGKTVIGPILKKNQIEYRNRVDKDVLQLSKDIGISHQYIERIKGVMRKLGRDEFTSKELSEILLISERSANRIIKKIIDAGYGEESRLEYSLGAGRPRRKIRIRF